MQRAVCVASGRLRNLVQSASSCFVFQALSPNQRSLSFPALRRRVFPLGKARFKSKIFFFSFTPSLTPSLFLILISYVYGTVPFIFNLALLLCSIMRTGSRPNAGFSPRQCHGRSSGLILSPASFLSLMNRASTELASRVLRTMLSPRRTRDCFTMSFKRRLCMSLQS